MSSNLVSLQYSCTGIRLDNFLFSMFRPSLRSVVIALVDGIQRNKWTCDESCNLQSIMPSSCRRSTSQLQVCNVAWSKHSCELVSTHGFMDNKVIVWKYPSLEPLAVLKGHERRVLFLVTLPSVAVSLQFHRCVCLCVCTCIFLVGEGEERVGVFCSRPRHLKMDHFESKNN